MFQPLEWFIGLRYLRSRRRRAVVSFMSAASLIGIALGVAALITILSVMNGLETETRTRLLSMSAQASVSAPGGFADWAAVERRLMGVPGVIGASPFVSIEGMLAAGTNLRPALVRGIEPEEERDSDLGRFVDADTLARLTPGGRQIVLGRILALNLGLKAGDVVTLLVPRISGGRLTPRYAAFTVAGVFEAGIQDHDAGLALVHLRDASDLSGLNGAAAGVAVRLDDPLAVQRFHAAVGGLLEPSWRYSDWTEEHRNLFTAIHIEKLMMAIILMLIVGVAAFNIVASLMMVVIDKQKDIAILRTYGLEPWRVARIFLVQGSVIGVVGTLAGTVLGLALALNVHVIVPWLEHTFGFQIMPGDVYYVTQIPSEVHLADVIAIPAVALVVAVLATVYPARRAAAVAPANALRYD
ncbi:MAG TPA: lipoprotein-releasing ABC transporter permease subunit [Gammaproteobacteria bacterium]|nr:lipoprotein-releasing ABC transporter permease subunit [Gammaproteobacteria bacterium]